MGTEQPRHYNFCNNSPQLLTHPTLPPATFPDRQGEPFLGEIDVFFFEVTFAGPALRLLLRITEFWNLDSGLIILAKQLGQIRNSTSGEPCPPPVLFQASPGYPALGTPDESLLFTFRSRLRVILQKSGTMSMP